MWTWIVDHAAVLALIKAIVWILPIFIIMPGTIWMERRLLGFFQDRVGPNRVGPFGMLQPIADGAKLFFKEEIVPSGIDKVTYVLAPWLMLIPPLTIGAVIPFAAPVGIYETLTPVADINVGVLYIMAMSSIGAYGVVLAGYSGNNKYSLMGGLRACAQLISYELSMGMAIGCVALMAGSLNVSQIVQWQDGSFWEIPNVWVHNWTIFSPMGFVAFIVFLICMIAESNRTPFDLPEAENELIAGYHTEYSSMKFASFYMGEYLGMLVFGTVLASLFLGGYDFLPIDWKMMALHNSGISSFALFMDRVTVDFGPVFLILKAVGVVLLYIWVRATLPRLRYDQLMNLGWKTLLPVITANLVLIAAWAVVHTVYGAWAAWIMVFVVYAIAIVVLSLNKRRQGEKPDPFESRKVTMVSGMTAEPQSSDPELAEVTAN